FLDVLGSLLLLHSFPTRRSSDLPFSGALFVFRNRRSKSIKILSYNSRGFWLCQKRLSKGRFRWWPESDQASLTLEAHQLQLLLAGGDPATAKGVAVWRPVQEKV